MDKDARRISSLDFVKLNYTDGNFKIVLPPTAFKSRELIIIVGEFKLAISNYSPPLNFWPPECDLLVYPKFPFYYKTIAQLLDIERVEELESISRHCFFVGGEPIESEGKMQLGLSQLEKLLGFGYSKKTEDSGSVNLSTGNAFLDIATHALLTFKVTGLEHCYSLDELHRMCKLAGELYDAAENKDKTNVDVNLDSETEDEEFVKIKGRVINQLLAMGVFLPDGF